jgi:hypothetical protein
MIFSKFLLPISLMVIIPAVGCAQGPSKALNNEEAEGRAVTNAAAVEAEAHNFVEIEFKEGSSVLSENAKSSLHQVIKQAKRAGTIEDVIVLSWSDEDYPAKSLKSLSSAQQELANKRNTNITHYMNSIKKVDVETYNMAQHPNTLSKWFNTSDTKMKNSFLAAGLPTTADSTQYASKASHSVILIKVE